MNAQKKRLLLKAAEGRVGASLRALTRRFGVSHQYVGKILKESNLKYKKRLKVPETTAAQQKRQKSRLRRLDRGPLSPATGCDVVMNDESCCTFSGADVPVSAGFYAGPDGDVRGVRFRPEGKLPGKLLVGGYWLSPQRGCPSQSFVPVALTLVATSTVFSFYRMGFYPSSCSSTTLKVDASSGPTSMPPITHDKRQLSWKKPKCLM